MLAFLNPASWEVGGGGEGGGGRERRVVGGGEGWGCWGTEGRVGWGGRTGYEEWCHWFRWGCGLAVGNEDGVGFTCGGLEGIVPMRPLNFLPRRGIFAGCLWYWGGGG